MAFVGVLGKWELQKILEVHGVVMPNSKFKYRDIFNPPVIHV